MTNTERFSEPLSRTLLRTVGIALGIGLAVGLPRHRPVLVLVTTAVALWFTLGGHYLEVFWRNGPRLRFANTASRLVARLVAWFIGGTILYAGAMATYMLLTGRGAPTWPWWIGGLFLVGAELVMHLGLVALRQANVYNGRG